MMEETTHQEDIAVVTAVKGRSVTVEIMPGGGCKDCSMGHVCGAQGKKIQHQIKTDLNLAVGDQVKIFVSPGVKLLSSLVIFILPIFDLILFYCIAKFVFLLSENFSIVIGLVGFLLSGILIKVLDKIYAEKINFEILEKI